MNWIVLIVAGLFECVWAVALKYSEAFTKFWPSVIVVIAMALSIFLLSISLKSIPLGTAYSVWTGIGAIGTVIYGMVFFDESTEILRIFFILLIFSGILGLKLISD